MKFYAWSLEHFGQFWKKNHMGYSWDRSQAHEFCPEEILRMQENSYRPIEFQIATKENIQELFDKQPNEIAIPIGDKELMKFVFEETYKLCNGSLIFLQEFFQEGDKVTYTEFPFVKEKGIIKQPGLIPRVVYKWDNEPENYKNYTGEATPINKLTYGW